VGVVDLTFRAIGAETMSECWPVFVAGAAVEVWVVRQIRRTGRFRAAWVASISIAVLLLPAVLWGESFLASNLADQTAGDGAIFDAWRDLGTHFARAWPLLVLLGVVLLALVRRPRSDRLATGLVVAAGVLVSWIVAMWLFTTNHQPMVFRLLVLPGGLAALASIIGFGSATALWMAIGRWVWKEGRRRRHRGITSDADGNLPQLRR